MPTVANRLFQNQNYNTSSTTKEVSDVLLKEDESQTLVAQFSHAKMVLIFIFQNQSTSKLRWKLSTTE